jgi:CHAD domain-containing protein
MRAILRTIQSFLEPDWTKYARQETGWMGSLLGEVRDWDVLLESFQTMFPDFSSHEQRSFKSILNKFEDQRSMARARLVEGLRSDRYLNLLNHLENSLPHLSFHSSPLPIGDLARKACDKLLEFVQSSNSLFPISALHHTRILLKRARYASELAEPLSGKHFKRFIQQTKYVQDLLGQHHDAMVAEERLLSYKQHCRGTGIAYVTGLMVERLRAQQGEVYRQIPEQWKKLEKQGKKL